MSIGTQWSKCSWHIERVISQVPELFNKLKTDPVHLEDCVLTVHTNRSSDNDRSFSFILGTI